MLDLLFFANSVLLGIGLAMDAFSVSVANGLNCPKMKKLKGLTIAGVFGFFQFAMPLIGWICVHFIVEYFRAFETLIPYIALALLLFIGIKMIVDTRKDEPDSETKSLNSGNLLLQGIATSIDALSVGFTTQEYAFLMALFSAIIIGLVTFVLCLIGIYIGKRFGNKWSKAELFGGIILIGIGLEIFIKGVFM